MEEEYISKMMGEEYASYARPMDADDQRRGPLVSSSERVAFDIVVLVSTRIPVFS